MIRQYGRDGVMGAAHPITGATPHEIGFVIEVTGPDQDTADAVLALARVSMLHTDFPAVSAARGEHGLPLLALRRAGRAGVPVLRVPDHGRGRPSVPISDHV